MSAHKIGMVAYQGLQLTFIGSVIAHICLGWGYPILWNCLLLVLAYAVVTVANRWGGAPDSPRRAREPVEVAPPVTGRWSALNSPADRTPSHGVHAHGQTYAIDIVAEPEPGSRPAFRWLWPLARRPQDFPAFGAPILAIADATVVRAADGQRDHLSRNSLPGLLYLMLIEGSVREMAGVRRILGNHVVLDLGNGIYAAYAHLQRGSLTVREGDRVHAGQVLARCGNSGNSSEPHLHFQLMDDPDPDAARGVPFTWQGIGVPRNGETFEAPPTVIARTWGLLTDLRGVHQKPPRLTPCPRPRSAPAATTPPRSARPCPPSSGTYGRPSAASAPSSWRVRRGSVTGLCGSWRRT